MTFGEGSCDPTSSNAGYALHCTARLQIGLDDVTVRRDMNHIIPLLWTTREHQHKNAQARLLSALHVDPETLCLYSIYVKFIPTSALYESIYFPL